MLNNRYKYFFVFCMGVIICLFLSMDSFAARGKIPHGKHKGGTHVVPVVVTQSPTIMTIPLTVRATAHMLAQNQTNITPCVSGYVAAILFKPGQYVEKDTLLIRLDDRKEKNNLVTAKADLKLSQMQYNRDQKSLKKGLVVQQVVYNDQLAVDKNKAVVQAMETALAYMYLKAPFSGYVGAKQFSIGDYVKPGQQLLALVDEKHLIAHYDLPSRFLSQLHIGQIVTITTDVFPHKIFHANVSYIAPLVDRTSQTVSLQAVVNNDQKILKPGQFINLIQQIGTISKAMMIPENSLLANISGYYVWTVKDHKVMSVPVKIGRHIPGKVQVLSGISSSAQVITMGQNQVHDGDIVHIMSEKSHSKHKPADL